MNCSEVFLFFVCCICLIWPLICPRNVRKTPWMPARRSKSAFTSKKATYDGKGLDENVETEQSLTDDQIVELEMMLNLMKTSQMLIRNYLHHCQLLQKQTWLASFFLLFMRMTWQRMICIHQNLPRFESTCNF